MPLFSYIFVVIACLLGCITGLLPSKIKWRSWLFLAFVINLVIATFIFSSFAYFSFIIFIYVGSLVLGHSGTINQTSTNQK